MRRRTAHHPPLSVSQNFLRDPRLVERLLDASSLTADDVVLDLGAGGGALTAPLARRCRRVVAVEKDARLAALLHGCFDGDNRIAVRHDDILRTALPHSPYKVFSNVPFTITSAVVTRLTSALNPPDDAYLIVQREAATRFQGVPRSTLYAMKLDPFFETTLTHRFRRSDFVPAPGVDVVLMRMRKRGPPLIARELAQPYRDLLVYCFGAWQPTVYHALVALLGLRPAKAFIRTMDLDLHRPPSALSAGEWRRFVQTLNVPAYRSAFSRVDGAEQRLRGRQETLLKSHRTRANGRV